MAKAQPAYSLVEQYALLDQDLPAVFTTINILKYRLLMACSNGGSLDAAKNRFLHLIQDTEIRTLFSSLLEIPDALDIIGTKRIQEIHDIFSPNYGYFETAKLELEFMGLPKHTTSVLETYFYSNMDPIYRLSITAAMVMFAYIKDDEVNNRKE
jgi:hypothetical protein